MVGLRPMLARAGELPTGDGWAYEVKWDGFRALVSTEDGLRVRSRRGWNMTLQLLELADLPTGLVLDGEIVGLNDDGVPHWPLVCQRLLHGDESVPLVLMIFDVLRHDGRDLTSWPYSERRRVLDSLALKGNLWRTPEAFDDGLALYQAVCDHGLEGVVAKRRRGVYRPGQRGSWVKVKNPDYWRRDAEIAAVMRKIEHRRDLPSSVAATSTARDARLSSRATVR
jgi:bifunctional non-homologous end joining protein LigD